MSKMSFTRVQVEEVKHVTEKAALIVYPDDFGSREIWTPLSVMTNADAEEIETTGSIDTIGIADWFADEKGLS